MVICQKFSLVYCNILLSCINLVFVKQIHRKYRYAWERIEASRGEPSLANARNGNLLSCTPLSTGRYKEEVSHRWRKMVEEDSSEHSIIGGNTKARCQLPWGVCPTQIASCKWMGMFLTSKGIPRKDAKFAYRVGPPKSGVATRTQSAKFAHILYKSHVNARSPLGVSDPGLRLTLPIPVTHPPSTHLT